MDSNGVAYLAPHALHSAARTGDIAQINTLLASGSDVNAEDSAGYKPLMWALYSRHQSAALTIINHGAKIDYRDLLAAIGFVDELVPLLIERRAAINPPKSRIVTPLMAAAGNETSDILLLLLDKGANIHARDYHQRTALFFAADVGRAENAQILLEHGIEINARNRRGNTALQVAIRNAKSRLSATHDYQPIIEMLLKAGGVL